MWTLPNVREACKAFQRVGNAGAAASGGVWQRILQLHRLHVLVHFTRKFRGSLQPQPTHTHTASPNATRSRPRRYRTTYRGIHASHSRRVSLHDAHRDVHRHVFHGGFDPLEGCLVHRLVAHADLWPTTQQPWSDHEHTPLMQQRPRTTSHVGAASFTACTACSAGNSVQLPTERFFVGGRGELALDRKKKSPKKSRY